MVQRKLDKLGRISMPAKYRKELGITQETALELTIEYGNVFIKVFNGKDIEKRAHIGVVRHIDMLGRIVIPSEYLEVLGLTVEKDYEICMKDEVMILKDIV